MPIVIILVILLAFLAFFFVARYQKKKDPEGFAEKRAQRRAKLESQRNALDRKVLLYYLGGHPQLTQSGVCTVVRSDDDQTVDVRLGKQSIMIPTQSIANVQLLEQSNVVAKQHSGVSGAIVGEMIAGPGGAVVGALATRRRESKVIHKDRAILNFKLGDADCQIVFAGLNRKPAAKWYPKAASVLSPYTTSRTN